MEQDLIREASGEEDVSLRELLSFMEESLELKPVDAAQYSPLVLAFLGDAVYEVLVRTKVVNHGSMQVSKMHKASADLVKAPAQAAILHLIEADLTEEEHAIYKRGRNAHSPSTAKNASAVDYRKATGLEALIGYLYLQKRFSRILALVSLGIKRLQEQEKEIQE